MNLLLRQTLRKAINVDNAAFVNSASDQLLFVACFDLERHSTVFDVNHAGSADDFAYHSEASTDLSKT